MTDVIYVCLRSATRLLSTRGARLKQCAVNSGLQLVLCPPKSTQAIDNNFGLANRMDQSTNHINKLFKVTHGHWSAADAEA